MPSAIADASVLIHLSALGRLDLLHSFYDKVVVPRAVWDEVVEEGGDRPGAQEVREAHKAGWLDVEAAENGDVLRLLRVSLGQGESEAIAMALSRSDHILLVDERDARRKAEIYDLEKTGVVGVLVRASVEGQIEDLKSCLHTLREAAGFWISDELIQMAVKRAGAQRDEA